MIRASWYSALRRVTILSVSINPCGHKARSHPAICRPTRKKLAKPVTASPALPCTALVLSDPILSVQDSARTGSAQDSALSNPGLSTLSPEGLSVLDHHARAEAVAALAREPAERIQAVVDQQVLELAVLVKLSAAP